MRKTEVEPTKAKPTEKSKTVAKTAPEKTLVKAEARIAAATPARAGQNRARSRAGRPLPKRRKLSPRSRTARSKPVVAETPKETPSARKVDTTATASIPGD